MLSSKKIVSFCLSIILSTGLVFSSGTIYDFAANGSIIAEAAEVPEDGEYTIELKGLEVDSDSTHLRSEDLINPARLIVSSGKIDVYFTSLGRELTFQNSSGGFENKTLSQESGSEIRSDGRATDTKNNYLVVVSGLSDEMIVRFAAGGSDSGYLTYRIVFDQSTLAIVSSGGNASGSSNGSDEAQVKTGDNSHLFYVTITLLFSVLTVYLLISKRKNNEHISVLLG